MRLQGIADVYRSAGRASLPRVTAGLLLVAGVCVPPSSPAQTVSTGTQSTAQPRPQDRGNDYRAAMAEEDARNYAAAAISWQKVEAAPETTPDVQSIARCHLGMAYEFGLGVPQDFDMAAKWYERAANTRMANGAPVQMLPGARQGWGLLYAYGLGVPRNREKARQILAEARADMMITLLDNDALPRTIRGNNQFFLDAMVAMKAIRQRQADAPTPPAQRDHESAAPPVASSLDDIRFQCTIRSIKNPILSNTAVVSIFFRRKAVEVNENFGGSRCVQTTIDGVEGPVATAASCPAAGSLAGTVIVSQFVKFGKDTITFGGSVKEGPAFVKAANGARKISDTLSCSDAQ
jgi:hypothetical protein